MEKEEKILSLNISTLQEILFKNFIFVEINTYSEQNKNYLLLEYNFYFEQMKEKNDMVDYFTKYNTINNNMIYKTIREDCIIWDINYNSCVFISRLKEQVAKLNEHSKKSVNPKMVGEKKKSIFIC
ncbi:hypothetical protein MKS88_001809 [Plasmodium brasilianum]|uniref:Uncharacterized protein n=1 Tax=Plasmodium brasilianum TaxID=5824 RepID=A0ACB9YAP2_PLABR|nr:hypothetical protein MKS88_001809 [Plasmodium brasilianum]